MVLLQIIYKLYHGIFLIILKFTAVDPWLAPAQLETDTEYNVYIPHERQSLDDCTARYFQYQDGFGISVAYGTPVELSEFAHMTALGVKKSVDTVSWHCGGSLISDNWVLGAAHCVNNQGKAVNMARLGDRNPFTSLDDEFAQELDVIDIIVHPTYRGKSRYFDIALFKLNGNIRPHKTVLPACLWTSHDTKILEEIGLEAIGFGANGTYEELTMNVQKVGLKLADHETCNENYKNDRKLPNGLMDHQICAIGDLIEGNVRPDTCQGDSGGPLQVKLLGNGRMTSFIVGITSFGKYCGLDDPGVYVQVSRFRDWIESVVGIDFEPRKCALRYAPLREYQPGIVAPYTEDNITEIATITINSIIQRALDITSTATLGYYKCDGRIKWVCGATLIAEQWLLTSASCLSNNPTVAHIGDLRLDTEGDKKLGQLFGIESIKSHPAFDPVHLVHDIGLVKLKTEIPASRTTFPACIWKKPELPVNEFGISGWGSRISNLIISDEFYLFEDDGLFLLTYDHETFMEVECDEICQVNKTKPLEHMLDKVGFDDIRLLEINNTVVPKSDCNAYFARNNKPQLRCHQVCLQNSLLTVPGICQLDVGGSVQRRISGFHEQYNPFVFAVNSYGNGCGFGSPVVATLVSPYAEWIESFVLKKPKFPQISPNIVHFIDNQLELNDPCIVDGYPASGTCKHYHDCPRVSSFYQTLNRSIQFCSFNGKDTASICCPNTLLTHPTRFTGLTTSDNCIIKYKHLRSKITNSEEPNENTFTHLVAIGYPKHDNNSSESGSNYVDYKCWGALVSDNLVVTTASCLTSFALSPSQVHLGFLNETASSSDLIVMISKIILHESFILGKPYNNVAVLYLEKNVPLSEKIIPACLWNSDEYIPLAVVVPGPESTRAGAYCDLGYCLNNDEKPLFLMQRDECDKVYKNDPMFDQGIGDKFLCGGATFFEPCFRLPGTVMQKSIAYDGVTVPYILGLYTYSTDCKDRKAVIFTRISSYRDWILSKI